MAAGAFSKHSGVVAASNTDATSYATGSNAPAANTPYLVAVATRRAAGTPNQPTLTGTNGWNVTWTVVTTITVSSLLRLTIFRGTTGATITAGALTADLGGQTQDAGVIFTVALAHLANTPVQSKTGTATAATTITVNFDNAMADAWNRALLFICNSGTTGTPSPLDNTFNVMIGTQSAASDGCRVNALASPGVVTGLTMAGLASSDICAILLELDHDGSDVSAAATGRQLVGLGPYVQV